MPHAGNAQITYPVKVGDSCWIAFAERSLDEWLGKSDGDNHDPRQYDLTDAVCFVGMKKYNQYLQITLKSLMVQPQLV